MTTKLTIAAQLDQLEALGNWVVAQFEGLAFADREDTVYAAQLAVHELVVNIIEHGYAGKTGTILIEASINPREAVFILTDNAMIVEMDGVRKPSFETLQERGFGLFLIEQLMDDFTYQRRRSQNVWRLAKSLLAENT